MHKNRDAPYEPRRGNFVSHSIFDVLYFSQHETDWRRAMQRKWLCCAVLTARAAEIPLTLDDAEAKVGEVLGVNCVSVNPFFED